MQIQPGVFLAAPQDFGRILAVWEESVRATHHFVAEGDIAVFKALIEQALPDLRQLVCVRDLAGQPAGFLAAADRKIEMLFIHPLACGQGAGRRLVRYALDHFQAAALDVNEQNEQALGFYLHMGFRVVGRSDLDGTGKPYPLLHMRYAGAAA
jgi:putative acetyltransferase